MQYHMDFSSFGDYKEEFKNRVEEFRNELDVVAKLQDKLEWEGTASTTALDLFSNKLYDLSVIPRMLDLYIGFFDKALGDYTDGMEDIKKTFEEILEQIRNEKRKRGEIEDV